MTMHHPQLAQAQIERGWTPTRVTVATALFNSGLSAAEVARLIGGVSRNAVIGKIHRGELASPSRKLPLGSTDRSTGQRQSRPKRQRQAHVRGPMVRLKAPKERPVPPSIVDAQIPQEQRRQLAELTDSCCHWPVGDPQGEGFFFCGAPKENDPAIPYCASHLFRAQSHDLRRREFRPGAFANAGPNASWRPSP